DADGPNEIAKVAVGPNPSYVAISPDNKTAYVTVTGADKVVAVDLETRTVAGEWTVGSGPAGIVRDAAGAFYYVALQGGQVVKVDAATGSIAATATVGEEPVGLAIDEGNNRLLVANRGDDSVSVVKLDTLEVEKTVKVGKEPVAVLLVANPSQPAAPAQPAQPATVENQGTVAVTAETDDAATQPGAPQ
ncbi:MAG TPA: YncE family protein, partial [bacterium]|nr:YncE family protein [bacterium]